jgi:hypothetical protein
VAGVAAPRAAPAREAPDLARDLWLDVRTSPDSLTVGDRLEVELQVDAPAGYEVHFPELLTRSTAADQLEFTPPAPPEKLDRDGVAKQRWTARYALAVFGVGEVALPPLTIEVRADSLHTIVTTDSLRLFVASVLTDSLATAGLQDLKPQALLAASKWPWILAAIALVALVAGFWWWRRRRRPRAEVVPLVRQRPADEVALEALRRLETRRLPLDGRLQEHWVAVSEILRRYLEDGFGVAALEETTEEILFDLERHGFDRAHVLQFRSLSDAGDLIKFAKREATIEESVQALEHARVFVTATAVRMRPLSEPETMAAVAGAAAGAAAATQAQTQAPAPAPARSGPTRNAPAGDGAASPRRGGDAA